MTAVSTLVEETRRDLHGSHRAEWNRLNQSVDDSATQFVLEFSLRGIVDGIYLSVGNEVVFVWTTTPSSNSATVQRGMLGTTAEAHTAGDLVEINPRFPNVVIRDALRDEIRSWPPELFQVSTLTVSGTTSARAYDLAGIDPKYYRVVEVRAESLDSEDSEVWRHVDFRTERSVDTTAFSSGVALKLTKHLDKARDLNVVYAHPFDVSTFVDATSLEDDVGLDPEQFDIARYGARWRLMSGREIKRTYTEAQGEPRKADEVPPGHITQTVRELKAMRDERIAEEAKRLAWKYPPRDR